MPNDHSAELTRFDIEPAFFSMAKSLFPLNGRSAAHCNRPRAQELRRPAAGIYQGWRDRRKAAEQHEWR
ncbi:MAG TPA: hypothetical protein VIR62_04340 [Allosphingosinicella sp.]